MELLSALYSVLFMIAFVLLTLILLSWGYYSYIRSAERKEKYVYIAYLAPLIAILTIFSWSLYAGIARFLIPSLIFMLIFAAALFLLKTRIRIKCTKEEEANIEGMDYKICYTDVVNTWYDPKRGKIYVSSKLHEALGRDELKAILLHERGHAESRVLRLFSASAIFLWYWGLS